MITQAKFKIGLGPMIFWQSYPSWRNFQFLLSNFCLDVSIRLKLHVEICHKNAQVKFKVCYGLLSFDIVVPLDVQESHIWNFQFPFFNFWRIEIADLMIFDSYSPWTWKKFK
jgi:hypothetical protein